MSADANVAVATGWRPIDTAPRDNKRPLYLAQFNSEGKLVGLDFNASWEYWEESWELSHINGWWWESANGLEEPTHWAYQDEPMPAESQVKTPPPGIDDLRQAVEFYRKVIADKEGNAASTGALKDAHKWLHESAMIFIELNP